MQAHLGCDLDFLVGNQRQRRGAGIALMADASIIAGGPSLPFMDGVGLVSLACLSLAVVLSPAAEPGANPRCACGASSTSIIQPAQCLNISAAPSSPRS